MEVWTSTLGLALQAFLMAYSQNQSCRYFYTKYINNQTNKNTDIYNLISWPVTILKFKMSVYHIKACEKLDCVIITIDSWVNTEHIQFKIDIWV